MAHLIPTLSVEEIDNKPERDVARALLEQLPNHVIVYHSYPWLRPDRNDRSKKTTLKEGEADFLILWPELGLLVLEVKGGDDPLRFRWAALVSPAPQWQGERHSRSLRAGEQEYAHRRECHR